MKTNLKKFISVFISAIMLVCVFVPTVFASSSWIDESLLYTDRYLISEKQYNLVGGVIEHDIVLNNKAKSNQIKGYVMEVDINDPDTSIVAGYNDGDLDGLGTATVREQATAYENKYNVNIIGAVNASPFDTSTGEIWGLMVMNGEVAHDTMEMPYFAILNDGTAVIRESYEAYDDVKEGVGGKAMLVADGKAVDTDDTSIHPRMAVGIRADGSVVFFVADGRQSPESCGMKYVDLAATMIAMGCVDAMALDGGGSATMLTQREGTDSIELANTPCYAGVERPVGSSLFICTTKEATGEFDHAVFAEPEYEVAPHSYVKFSYCGADANGFAADLPENGYLEVADGDYGYISGSKFYANSKQGTTTLNYVVDGEVVGSATIVVTNEADNFITAFFKEIKQMLSNFFNLFQFFLEKIGLS